MEPTIYRVEVSQKATQMSETKIMNMLNQYAARNTNIELLRIIAMIGVVILHSNYGIMYKSENLTAYFLIECLFINSVNVFMIISGYFMVKKTEISLCKPIIIIAQCMIFRCMIFLINNGINIHNWKRLLISSLPNMYFIILYCAVYILSPYINKLVSILERNTLKHFVGIIFILFSLEPYCLYILQVGKGWEIDQMSTLVYAKPTGYSIVNFIMMYIFGAYIRKYKIKIRMIYSGLGFLFCVLLMYVFTVICFYKFNDCWIAWDYCNPIIVLAAVCEFLFFSQVKINNNKYINWFASASLSVYILNGVFIKLFNINSYSSESLSRRILLLFLISIIICIFCFLCNNIYSFLLLPFNNLITRFCGKYKIKS